MTDTPMGPGWWLASDGRWYPPELAPPTPDGGGASEPSAAALLDRFTAWGRRIAIAAIVASGVAALLFILTLLVLREPCPEHTADVSMLTLPAIALVCLGVGGFASVIYLWMRRAGERDSASAWATIALIVALLLLVGGIGSAVEASTGDRRSGCLVYSAEPSHTDHDGPRRSAIAHGAG